jgi:hypothetical protein
MKILERKGLIHEATQSLMIRTFQCQESISSYDSQDVSQEGWLRNWRRMIYNVSFIDCRTHRGKGDSHSYARSTMIVLRAVYEVKESDSVPGKGPEKRTTLPC